MITEKYEDLNRHNYELETEILKAKTDIIILFDKVSSSDGSRRGLQRARNIFEVRELRKYSSDLKRLIGPQQ